MVDLVSRNFEVFVYSVIRLRGFLFFCTHHIAGKTYNVLCFWDPYLFIEKRYEFSDFGFKISSNSKRYSYILTGNGLLFRKSDKRPVRLRNNSKSDEQSPILFLYSIKIKILLLYI